MEQRRRIAFATSSRADYGPARWVLADLQARPDVDLVVIATGTHVDAAHGGTLAEIAADGIVDVVQVPVVIGTDDPVDRAAVRNTREAAPFRGHVRFAHAFHESFMRAAVVDEVRDRGEQEVVALGELA